MSNIFGGNGSGSGSGSASAWFMNSSGLAISNTSVNFYTGVASNTGSINENSRRTPSPVSGTITAIYVNAIVNASTVATTFTVRVNGVSSTVVASVPALTTGVFSDTAHSVAISAGDLISFQASISATGTIQGSISVKVVQ